MTPRIFTRKESYISWKVKTERSSLYRDLEKEYLYQVLPECVSFPYNDPSVIIAGEIISVKCLLWRHKMSAGAVSSEQRQLRASALQYGIQGSWMKVLLED